MRSSSPALAATTIGPMPVSISKTMLTPIPALVLPLLLACPSAPSSTTPEGDQAARRPLDAVLFGYIPDAGNDGFAGLQARLERDFEAEHPEIDLRLVIDGNIDLYDLSANGQLATYFGTGDGSADVLELDMVLLADLVANGWIAPARVELPAIVPSAEEAVTLDGTRYGTPTYLCGNFIYSRAPELEGADDANELLEILGKAAGPGAPPLIGNYAGSWTLPSFYLDAWADGHDNAPASVQTAYPLPLDEVTVAPLRALTDSCASSGKNPCLDKTYKDNTKAELAFAQGQAGGFVGYSERLHYIVAAAPSAPLPKVISAPMGNGNKPISFTDALVTSASCTEACRDDADAFITFMSALERRQLIAFSQDVPPDAPAGVTPRYLLQALSSFYTTEPAASNPIYRALQPVVTSQSRSFPNAGFPQARGELSRALNDALRPAE
jgi:thiamine pyridinylase